MLSVTISDCTPVDNDQQPDTACKSSDCIPGPEIFCNNAGVGCYVSSLPGILNPTDNNAASGNGASGSGDGNIGVTDGDLNSAGFGSGPAIKDTMAFADPNGDVSVRIAGPFAADDDSIEQFIFTVYISKENAREKFVVYKNIAPGNKGIEGRDPFTQELQTVPPNATELRIPYQSDDMENGVPPLQYDGKQPMPLTRGLIFSQLNSENPSQCYYYLKIDHKQLVLARGTYVVRVYKEKKPKSGEFSLLRMFTLTVRADPIQGPDINFRYLSTQNRYGM